MKKNPEEDRAVAGQLLLHVSIESADPTTCVGYKLLLHFYPPKPPPTVSLVTLKCAPKGILGNVV